MFNSIYHKSNYLLVLLLPFCFVCCQQPKQKEKLPILGNPTIVNNDTVYPQIKSFLLTNQDSQTVTNKTFDNKIYIADFVFLSCPSICPKMNESMLKVYKAFEENKHVMFLSHTIDPENDTIPRLKSFTENLGVSSNRWNFVTGNQDSIYNLADKSYYATAYKDSTAPGGFAHSGGLLLIDKNRHIRGVYDGTEPAEAERLIKDIHLLLKEQF